MRADRLISILLLLQVHQRMTANELSARLEVSERTIYRDMDALSMAGVPVVADRGVGGGWYLLDNYQTNLTGLNFAEVQTLFLTPDSLLSDLGLHQASNTALDKLLASLPDMHRRDAEYVRQRIHIDGPGSTYSKDDVGFLPTLQTAVWEERKLDMTYHLSTGPIVECIIDPLGLVARGRTWYLVAIFEEELSVYRVSRIRNATILEEPAIRPTGFNLTDFWAESCANFAASRPQYPVTARVKAALLSQVNHVCHGVEIEATSAPDEAGWIDVSMVFETEAHATQSLMSFGPGVEVLSPNRLRTKIIERAKDMVALYAAQVASSSTGYRLTLPALSRQTSPVSSVSEERKQ